MEQPLVNREPCSQDLATAGESGSRVLDPERREISQMDCRLLETGGHGGIGEGRVPAMWKRGQG